MPSLVLSDRAVIRIAGADAEKLLHDVVTPDIKGLTDDDAMPGALLTPQGKIMFDFLITRDAADGFLIDIRRDDHEAFIKRMMLYRLRAKAEIAAEPDLAVIGAWGENQPEGSRRDRRFRGEKAVYRAYAAAPEQPADDAASPSDYARLRIAESVAELGADFESADVFPHDVLMDLNGGVSFKKGCFVGQEVVSRMQHRGTARRRLAIAEADHALPPSGSAVTAGGKPAGTLGTVEGASGLALVRTDRIGSALHAGERIEAGDAAIRLHLADWTGLAFAADLAEV